VQVVAQVVVEAQSMFPEQGPDVVAAIHVPLPLHFPVGVRVPLLQDECPQAVPVTCKRQAPRPSQVPSRPHSLEVSTEHSVSGSVPAETGRQRPLEAPVLAEEQAMQEPVQAFSQQKPSAHVPETHSLAVKQLPPVAFLPTQVPPGPQVFPVRQSLSDTQEGLQAVPEAQMTPPAHEVADAVVQAPALQVPLAT
jgi:hypothetical protein